MAQQNSKKYPFYFYLILISIPFLFFILLEFGLRVFNYGEDIPQWVVFSPQYPDKIALNPAIGRRYFHTNTLIPTPWVDPFDKEKKPNTIRIFVLGESSAAGYPYDLKVAFSGEMKRRLLLLYPEKNIEVINLGMAAINSYTILDLIDGVIEQKPDAIAIYTGHNEYYGAWGVGSTENIGNQRWLIRFVMKAEKYKTVQMLRNFISYLMSVGTQQATSRKTLMESMVNDQLIPYQSDLFKAGVDQYSENMEIILSKIKNANIPVVIGNLTSNIKDQVPFISQPIDSLPSASDVYSEAQKFENNSEFKQAFQKYSYARNLDLLRFRAPSELNNEIAFLAKKFQIPFVDIDSLFKINSPNQLPGNNLFIDHLHPNIAGYRLMGKLFLETIIKSNLLGDSNKINLTEPELDRLSNQSFNLTKVDSLTAEYSIRRLKAGWPFIRSRNSMIDPFENFKPQNQIEFLAMKVVNMQLNIDDAHFTLAMTYKKNRDTKNFLREMNALIEVIPYHIINYEIVATYLINEQQFNSAIPYLRKIKQSKNDAFSNKWLGIISFSNNDMTSAKSFMEESRRLKSDDPQLLYNLSGLYFTEKNNSKALETISECLKINPDFPGAKELYHQLQETHSK